MLGKIALSENELVKQRELPIIRRSIPPPIAFLSDFNGARNFRSTFPVDIKRILSAARKRQSRNHGRRNKRGWGVNRACERDLMFPQSVARCLLTFAKRKRLNAMINYATWDCWMARDIQRALEPLYALHKWQMFINILMRAFGSSAGTWYNLWASFLRHRQQGWVSLLIFTVAAQLIGMDD